MRVGYFTHTPIQVSETFLDKMLESLAGEFSVVFYCGQRSSKRTYPCEVQFMGFAENEIDARWGDYFSRVRRRLTTSEYRISVQERTFVKRFKRLLVDGLAPIDFAFIEYGTTAVAVAPYLAQLGIPYAVNFHGYDASASLGDRAYQKRIRQVVAGSSFFIVPSNHLRRRIELLGLRHVPCHVLPYSPKYASLPQPTTPVAPIVVSLGRLTEKKCPEALVMVASMVLERMPAVRFKFIGGGPLHAATQALIDDMGVADQVELLGELPHAESLKIISSATLFIQHSVTAPSGDQEGFPVALAEAAALSKAIVSTYHSGIVENVEHGKSGYLVQEHDYESMANHVVELLQDPAACELMGTHGRHRIQKVSPLGYRESMVVKMIRKTF